MATTNSPYTRTTWVEDFAWNQIIQEVNVLAENPDEGCDPLAPLDEVPEDHIWNKTDVNEVHDKLKEICPDNQFTELIENQPWTSLIVDEIKDALVRGWCECEPILDDRVLGQWTVEKAYGHEQTTMRCGGTSWIISGPMAAYAGIDEFNFPVPCYDTQQYAAVDLGLWETIGETYTEAREKSDLWTGNRRNELLQQQIVEEDSATLKSKKEQLESLQNQLTACESGGGDCSSISEQISEINSEITDLEESIQEAKDKRDGYRDEAITNLADSDAAATENWDALQELQSWDPATFNIVADHISEITSEWGLGSNPEGHITLSWWRVLRVRIPGYAPDVRFETTKMIGFFTPSGLPFSKNNPLDFGNDWYFTLRKRHKCGIWDVSSGNCPQGLGEWGEWENVFDVPSLTSGFEGDMLELTFEKTDGTEKAEEYDPNPNQ